MRNVTVFGQAIVPSPKCEKAVKPSELRSAFNFRVVNVFHVGNQVVGNYLFPTYSKDNPWRAGEPYRFAPGRPFVVDQLAGDNPLSPVAKKLAEALLLVTERAEIAASSSWSEKAKTQVTAKIDQLTAAGNYPTAAVPYRGLPLWGKVTNRAAIGDICMSPVAAEAAATLCQTPEGEQIFVSRCRSATGEEPGAILRLKLRNRQDLELLTEEEYRQIFFGLSRYFAKYPDKTNGKVRLIETLFVPLGIMASTTGIVDVQLPHLPLTIYSAVGDLRETGAVDFRPRWVPKQRELEMRIQRPAVEIA